VTNVLSALEDAESQRSEEVSGRQQTGSWTQCESSVAAQEVVHLLELWNTILDKDFFLLELDEDFVVLAASVLWHQVFDNIENALPSAVLGLGVVNVWNCVTAD